MAWRQHAPRHKRIKPCSVPLRPCCAKVGGGARQRIGKPVVIAIIVTYTASTTNGAAAASGC
jgi:hypothetical protein